MKENPSRSYWKEREEQARKERAKREKGYQEEIKEIYEDMLDDVQKEIDSFYAKYAKKEGISIGEAKKRASKLDIEEYARKAKKYVKSKDFSKEANEDMRLYNMTMKVNRLELLKAKIALELTGNFDKLRDYYDEVITDESMKEFERLAGILGKTITKADTVKRVKAIVGASFHNATFSERIWGQKELLKLEVEKHLRTALIQGKGSRELARRLRKVFGVSQYNAERLMTTELRRAQTEVAKQSYEKNGNEKYEYMATGPHPCKICKGLDGKIFNVSDMMPGENAPPMHPQCHCTTGPSRDMEDYHAWLDWLDRGGTTEEWERLKTLGKSDKMQLTKKEKKTLLEYKSSASYRINELLRNHKDTDELPEQERKFVEELDSALSKMPQYEGNLIRTVDFTAFSDKNERIEKFMKEYVENETVTINQYWSMSKERGYNEDADVQIYVQSSKRGRDISSIGLDEKEVLYERKQEFCVVKTVNYNGKYFILLKER